MPLVRLEFDGAVAKVVLNHSNGNRINFAMREELLDEFEGSPPARRASLS